MRLRLGNCRSLLVGLMALLPSPALAQTAGEIVLENSKLRLVLGDDAVWRSLVDKGSGKDYCPREKKVRFASAEVGGKSCSAVKASRAGERLTVAFQGCDTRLTYEIRAAEDWIAFRLVGVSGTRPTRLTLLRLGVTITQHVGPRMNAAWDDRFGVCLGAMNLQTQGHAVRRGGYAELAATTQDAPGPKLEGAAAAVLAGAPAELRSRLRKLAAACDLPRNEENGVPAKELRLARDSYWFLSFGEKDVPKVIDYCRRTGFRQVMMSSGSWCRNVGHYTFNTGAYPDGIESLKRSIDRLHREGILVGMHCFASKISKTDAYVTPEPDRRFWVDTSAPLAANVDATATAIRMAADLSQWPGSPVSRQKYWEGGVGKHQEVILDDEIVRYQSIGPEGKWDTFLGCQRGAYGTKAAAHKSGAAGRHYGVDGCISGYIVDQETTLLDETTARLAEIFNTCGFDMVYFDGGEDVDKTRFDYYVSKFQAAAMAKFRKRPIVHMGTIMTHNLWHSFTRSGTVDTYLNTLYGHILAGGKIDTWPTVRNHIDGSVAYMLSVGDDMVPGELGWFGIWPKGKDTDGLQLDEIEYLMAKSLAYDAPISLQTSFAQMESHPLTPGLLEIVGAYERLRRSGSTPEAVRARLREKGQDFVLIAPAVVGRATNELPAMVAVEPVPIVAGGRDVRAMAGAVDRDTFVTLWHYLGKEGELVLDAGRTSPGSAAAFRMDGAAVKVSQREGRITIPIDGRRTTLLLAGVPLAETRRMIQGARWESGH